MIDDSDIDPICHTRAVVRAVIASVIGDPPVFYVSGGAEHQGPSGPVAVVVPRG